MTSRALSFTTLLTLGLASTAYAGEADEKAAAQILDQRMKTQRPDDYVILKSVEGKDVVVVAGSMDHIEQVLTAAHIRHTLVQPAQVAGLDLNANQILMINCPGIIPQPGLRRIEKFVRAGGLLYTTDWSLVNVVQKIFPGTIAHNGVGTGDHVTPVQVDQKHDDLMSNMLLKAGHEPQWWLEGGSYPIKILDPKKVEVLASSAEMKKQYGAAPVVVRFKWDDGEVIHVVSHFYRQVQTQGPAIAAKDAIDGVEGMSKADKEAFKKGEGANAKFGDVASSYAFQQMTSNLVVEKQKANKDLDKSYAYTPSAPVVIDGRRASKGDRIKVLERKAGKVRARDDRGNEAWLDEAVLEAR